MLAVVLGETVRSDPAARRLVEALARLNVPPASAAVPPALTWLVTHADDPEIPAARAAHYRIAVVGTPEFPDYDALADALAAAYTAAALGHRALIRSVW
ncbi:MAG: hypothetical protein NVSMB64_16940 [Candidatus Velthaea sp.]